jgi:Leucine-rich repeat (LRR) protein
MGNGCSNKDKTTDSKQSRSSSSSNMHGKQKPPKAGKLQLVQRLSKASKSCVFSVPPCSLSKLDARVLKLHRLRVLNLDHNKFKRIPPGIAALAGSLKQLSMAHNLIAALPAEAMHELIQLTKLEVLNLAFNSLVAVPWTLLPGTRFPHLNRLELNNNRIAKFVTDEPSSESKESTSAAAAAAAASSSLGILNLSHNALVAIPASVLRPLTGLSELVLNDNQLDALPDCMQSWQSLCIALLQNNRLTALPASLLSGTAHSIDFSGNPIESNPDKRKLTGFLDYEKRHAIVVNKQMGKKNYRGMM